MSRRYAWSKLRNRTGRMVLRPSEDGLMGRMQRWVMATHIQWYHAHDHAAGEGGLSPSRFKSFPVADGDHSLADSSNVQRDRRWESAVGRARTESVTRVRRARPTFFEIRPGRQKLPCGQVWAIHFVPAVARESGRNDRKDPRPLFKAQGMLGEFQRMLQGRETWP
jgi:hypothetical protein